MEKGSSKIDSIGYGRISASKLQSRQRLRWRRRNNSSLKRRREPDPDAEDASPLPQHDGGVDLSLLEAVEKSQSTIKVFDLKTLKKLILAFEGRLRDKIEARLKYHDQPEKLVSEVELHDELQKLKFLAGGPDLYPKLVNLNTIPLILGLLNHDNTDISIDAVSLLQDLTD